ncbi:MAG: iron-siderophore ABC transporter substrate-binding protein [Cyanosarcina radialis HA8281-LM2]|jgi:iron complex transport system substrate-binding protein|nr:iron-siderophore ABC transporter substrate-binding protein [Cyanosarcina radialis HA8281-LM2]
MKRVNSLTKGREIQRTLLIVTAMMKRPSDRLIKLFLLIAFSCLFITACYQPVIQSPHLSSKPAVECRVIQHALGETCVPLNPQRIVALNPERNLDALIAFGIKPIGYTGYDMPNKGKPGLFGASLDAVAGAEYVGNAYQPDLEKILKLKPDLILDCCQPPHYELLSTIAPTVPVPDPYWDEDNSLYKSTDRAFYKENLRYHARLLNQEAKAEEVLNQYYQRVNQLKQRLGNQLQQLEISVIFFTEGGIFTITDRIRTLPPAIFNDVGLRYKFLSQGRDLKPSVSIETIDEFDSDILFIVDYAERPSSYFQHPMFKSLKVVKNNRAYVVDPETWGAQGILGANRILDDLFKYLPSGE